MIGEEERPSCGVGKKFWCREPAPAFASTQWCLGTGTLHAVHPFVKMVKFANVMRQHLSQKKKINKELIWIDPPEIYFLGIENPPPQPPQLENF